MVGTMWVNTGIGALASVITLVTALSGNVWLVSLERAGYAFILFFLAAFPIRWLVAKIMGSSERTEAAAPANVGSPADAAGGPVPSAEEDQDSDEEEGFTPLALDQFRRVTPNYDPTTVADVVRRLTDE
ncbi:hypothetical protein KDJ56_09650 [Brevibacillus composti]|uniref:Uncharacterized protein n=1 Tax=Brevibacillus composti TaxID=2796470 RepID=A0A7T5JQB5_9BACL|nr:hypothetical protein [Brevibacillus composti]QQE76154.1 hypothetical protein JD108_09955 [Brevibacillus composti]QUO43183.1 hypothetical protein KDJ56_09650 [Brevibacillus composti]